MGTLAVETGAWALYEFENEKMISEDDLKIGEQELQKITDEYVEETNSIGDHKETEVLEV